MKFYFDESCIYYKIKTDTYLNLTDMDMDAYTITHPDIRNLKGHGDVILVIHPYENNEVIIDTTFDELVSIKPTRTSFTGIPDDIKLFVLAKKFENNAEQFSKHMVEYDGHFSLSKS